MHKVLFLLLFPAILSAQTTFRDYKKYPFPTELTAAETGTAIAWATDEEGRRNVYVAKGPEFLPRKITSFDTDDGQEITSLSITRDGGRVVFVRGGDHGSNWDGSVGINPGFDIVAPKVQIMSVPFMGGETKILAEGDYPVVHPDGKTVAFIKAGQVFTVPTDGASQAKALFYARGNSGSLQWSPNGRQLLFISNRTDHSIIGIFTEGAQSIKWINPSYYRDVSPRWSPDGESIVFVRTPGQGGAPDSMLVRKHNPWALYTANVQTGQINLLWQSPTSTLRGSVPNTHGGYNLHWAAENRIVFLSYLDGWPHLYTVPSEGGTPLLLTPGNFMCEHIKITADKKSLLFSANTGKEKDDIERRHAVKVSVDKADMKVLTEGKGLEWTPVQTGDGSAIAYIGATATMPPQPAILKLAENQTLLIAKSLLPREFPSANMVIPKQVIFKAADGVEVHADLFEPTGGLAKKPAIIYVHGGPPRQMLLGWHYSDYYSNAYAANQYLANLGFVVLSVNYRLGIGYGYEFHNAPKGGANGAAEYQDIKAAGEWLQNQTFVDPNKIGIYGGSYGGYLTALALARDSKIFAAGVDIHGVHDFVAGRFTYSNSGDRYEQVPDYDLALKTAWESSPVSSLNTWTSPVLIIHGDDDRNVRFNQSVDLIRRLEKNGVSFETLMIPDDTHHWMKHENAVKVYEAMANFFSRKLK
jgi:dipeptidyl aminopeptidase/acylaminoacyl peptidase